MLYKIIGNLNCKFGNLILLLYLSSFGAVGGKKQNTGSFVWICKYKLINGLEITEHGMTTLIR
jgi:hypothetical protein